MSLSTNQGKTPRIGCYCSSYRLRQPESVDQQPASNACAGLTNYRPNCKAQTSSFWRLRPAWTEGLFSKLIKEDHFACTTKMSEFFRSDRSVREQRPSRTGISTRLPEYIQASGHTSSRPSDYSLVKERLFITTPALSVTVSSFSLLDLSARGRRILSLFPSLSIACRENFFSDSE